VPAAQLQSAAGRAAASCHQARLPAEYRVLRAEDELIGAELRPDRGHQAGQQPRACGRVAGRLAEGHAVTSAPGNTVAVTLTATPLRIPRACR
jgi:hypothetical protein